MVVKHLFKEEVDYEMKSFCGINLRNVDYEYDYGRATCKNCLRLNKGEIYIDGKTFKDHEKVKIRLHSIEGTARIVLKNRRGKLQWFLMDYWCELLPIDANEIGYIRKLDYQEYIKSTPHTKSFKEKMIDWVCLTFAKI